MEAAKTLELAYGKAEEPERPYDTIAKRRTKEQIVALCGPVGSGTADVAIKIGDAFRKYGYDLKIIKASDLIKEAVQVLEAKGTVAKGNFKCEGFTSEGERISALQDMGDWLRGQYGCDAVAQLFIKKVSTFRQKDLTKDEATAGQLKKEPQSVVWILDSLKNPDEVKLLRLVYDKMFSLIGVLCTSEVKKNILVNLCQVSQEQAMELIKRDESEDFNHGQKLIKTLQHGDFFIRNAPYATARVLETVDRYVKIILGDHSITPTHGEYAMYLAQSAAYRSGCMSRQVGAAVLNDRGEIIATGFNDVPKFGGGLYIENTAKDARCFKVTGGECRNELRKKGIRKKLGEALASQAGGATIDAMMVAKFCDESGISDLTEYCRAVHAEMDAITSAARKGFSLRDGMLFVTTFPCHNCAKHIVASGIKKVYYIEPYEKSLAISMHEDSISTREDAQDAVFFLPFEGVAPRQYQNRFCATTTKKDGGKFVQFNVGKDTPAYAQLLDCFAEYEGKIVDSLDKKGL